MSARSSTAAARIAISRARSGWSRQKACELVRVALAGGREHPTSKCLAISLKILKRHCPGLKVIVSYADTKEGHLGTIYQATNWLFVGAASQPYLKVRGADESQLAAW